MTRTVIRLGPAIVLLVAAGCASTPVPSAFPAPSLGPGEIALPEQPTDQLGSPPPCGGYGFVGPVSLHGSADDPRLTWIDHEITREQEAVVWPRGYRARFAPHLEVLDAAGDVVAREGDLAQGACPMPAGQLLVEMASPTPGRTTVRPAVSITCGQIKADFCHDAIFLAGSVDAELLDAATAIVVDDVCPPTTVCDRRYPFMAMVVLIDGPSVTGTYQVVGQNGPDDRADVWNAPLPAHIAAAVAAITGASKESSPAP